MSSGFSSTTVPVEPGLVSAGQPVDGPQPGIDAARLRVAVLRLSRRLRKHDLREDEPSLIAKTVHELTFEFLDPWHETADKCSPAA